jgi:hypothetical protein
MRPTWKSVNPTRTRRATVEAICQSRAQTLSSGNDMVHEEHDCAMVGGWYYTRKEQLKSSLMQKDVPLALK